MARYLFIVCTLVTIGAFAAENGPVGHWILTPEHVTGRRVQPVAGEQRGVIPGQVTFSEEPVALALDGISNCVKLGTKPAELDLPAEALTAEAWVRVSNTADWGGIIGAFQDNGDLEQGWLLGNRDARFCFAVSTRGVKDDDNGKLTYLVADRDLKKDRWTHAVGTYDGKQMRIYVDGEPRGVSEEQSGPIWYPEKVFYEIGAYHDDDECFFFSGAIHEVRVYDRALSETEIRAHYVKGKERFPDIPETTFGPYLRFTGLDSAVIEWKTATPMPTAVEYGIGRFDLHAGDATPKTEHQVALAGLKHKTLYHYRIVFEQGGKRLHSPRYECDTYFNYTVASVPEGPAPFPEDALSAVYAQAADHIVNTTGIRQGYCLVLGCAEGRLAYEIAKRTKLFVVGVDTAPAAVDKGRAALRKAGAYGLRVVLRHADTLDNLPMTDRFANLVVSDRIITEGKCVGSPEELARVLRPDGGIALFGSPKGAPDPLHKGALASWTKKTGYPVGSGDGPGVWARIVRPKLPGAGQWTHQYARPDNSGRSGESLGGATAREQLRVQWVGRPGPRAMVDRNPRVPAPLCAGDKLFTQGLHRVIAQDAYNGAILWSLEIPHLERFNMPRDCSNWCADEDSLFMAVRGACWRVAAATGHIAQVYEDGHMEGDYDWGYVARSGSQLIGSSVIADTSYTDFWGKAMWYDASDGPGNRKVCSDALFSLDKQTGQRQWAYRNGVIINPTITIADGRVFFVESRDPAVKAAASRRIGIPELWNEQFLVALDIESGRAAWERRIDTADGAIVFYLIHANGKLVIAASDTRYHLHAFDAADGRGLWATGHAWTGGDHSGHMQHPVVVGNTVYVEPCGYDLDTGARVTEAMGRHEGCATYAGVEGALIYRGQGRCISIWDVEKETASSWTRLRPGCWLTTIAGNGMALFPEGGGGCSCGNWMETSIAFAPQAAE